MNQDLFESLKKKGADLVSSCDLTELPMAIRSGLDKLFLSDQANRLKISYKTEYIDPQAVLD